VVAAGGGVRRVLLMYLHDQWVFRITPQQREEDRTAPVAWLTEVVALWWRNDEAVLLRWTGGGMVGTESCASTGSSSGTYT
jgi:hypothetical protein